MKAFGKKISKLVNLVGESVDLNTLKEKQKKIDKKYEENLSKLKKKLIELDNDKKEIIHLYEFKNKYQKTTNSIPTTVFSVVSNEKDSEDEDENESEDEESEKDKTQSKEENKKESSCLTKNTIRERINLVFEETIMKLNIIENDVENKIKEINDQKEELEKQYLIAKEDINLKLRNVRDKINKKKEALF